MDIQTVGDQIAMLRKQKGLTQTELGERLGITFQAVSKWERGETLPDTAILPDLADVLETSIDNLLTGGKRISEFKGKFQITQLFEGLSCLNKMGELLGRDNLVYRCAIEGINKKMNTRIEDCFMDSNVLECFVTEAAIHNLNAGKYVDPTDVKNSFRNAHFREILLEHCRNHGIK